MAKKEVNFMGLKEKKINTVGGLVVQCIWMAVALFFFFSGLKMFREDKTFVVWLIWGANCCVPMLFDIIKSIVVEAKRGWNEGAREYSVTVDSSSVTVQNHPLRGAIISIVVTLFFGVLSGPIFLGLSLFGTLIAILEFVIHLIKTNKSKKQDNNGAK